MQHCNIFDISYIRAIKASPMETCIVQVATGNYNLCSLMVGQNIYAYIRICIYIYNKSPALSIKRLDKKITGLIASNEIFLSNWKAFAI